MNLIFLDFDGVLNSVRSTIAQLGDTERYTSFMQRHQEELDPVAVRLVGRLAKEIHAEVIVSSSWRKIHRLEEINEMLAYHGGPKAIAVTPSSAKGFRGDEIDQFIKDHPELFDDEKDKYVILDDDSDFHIWQKKNFVHVNMNNGFGLEHFVACLKIINPTHPMLNLDVYVEPISRK